MRTSPAQLTSNTCEWRTPEKLFRMLDREFHFTLDPCCTHESALCLKHYTKAEDGLKQDWSGEVVYCNPPYGKEMPDWIRKCATERATVVALLPARTDTKAFHEYIFNGSCEVRFIRGRLKFGGARYNAPFPSVAAIWRNMECKWA